MIGILNLGNLLTNLLQFYTSKRPLLSVEQKDFVDMEIKDARAKELEDQHPHTVDKLNKRNERIQVPDAN